MTNVYTYPEMNKIVKALLKNSDEPMLLYAAARIEELEKAQWISVEEQLPERETEVLVYAYNHNIWVWEYHGSAWEDEEGYYHDLEVVTHWMPLPEPPKGERNG